MTKSVKTAVSLPAETYARAEALRRKTKKSRSALYAAALKTYLKAEEVRLMEEQYATGYKAHPDDPKEMEAWTRISTSGFEKEDW